MKHKVWGAVGVLGALFSVAPLAYANPEGGVVAAGSATITNADKITTIKQSSDRAVIDWRRFDIAPDETTRFEQPSVSSMTLNRVNDIKPSQIQGKLIANGGLVIVNPNGVIFGKDSVVDAASILATTADIHNKNFMQGNMLFNKTGSPEARILNEGLITAREAGLVGFVAPSVENNGIITAKVGKVSLASGDSFTLDFIGDGLIKVQVSGALKKQLAANYGTIEANGGTIQITAAAARNALDSLIMNTGALKAQTVSRDKQGNIYIRNAGGDVVNAGTIDTSGREKNQRGGDITVTGKNVALMDGTLIDTSGHTGRSNTTNDKTLTQKREGAAGGDIKIGGDYLGKGDTPTAQNLYVSPNSFIFNDALESGDAGRTIFWSDNVTSFYGNVFARANVGDGGFVETSGYKFLDAQGNVDLTTNNGQRGTYFLDPTDIAIYGDTANGGPAPNYVSTDGSINLASSLRLWLDASDTSKVNLTYSSNGITGTVSGTSGTNTLTTTNNNTANLVVGAKIRVSGADATTALANDTTNTNTYTIAAIDAGTITTVEPLTTTYNAGTAFYRGLVNQVTDKSTAGNNLTQASVAIMPLWISATGNNGIYTISNRRLVRINSSSFADKITFFSSDTPAFSSSSIPQNYGVFELTATGYNASNSAFVPFIYDTTPRTSSFLYNVGSGYSQVGIDSSAWSQGVTNTSSATFNSTTLSSGRNGKNSSNTTFAARTLNNQADLYWGFSNFSGGYVGVLKDSIAYNDALGANSRNLVEQYQSAKWGIALDPNSGTALSEVVEATDATTGYSVFTTRYLERLSTSANISLQATNNITLDLKGDNLNFTTANRSLTLNAGNQIINASAGTITTNNGAISLTGTTGGIVLNNALTLNSGTATTTFNSRINGANNLTATAGTFSFAQPLGGTTPLGAVSLTSANAFNLPSISASSITASTTTGNIAGAGGLVTSGGNLNLTAGTDLDLSAIGIITNNGNATLGGRDVTLNTWINTGTGNFTVNASRDIFLTRNNLTSGLVGRWEFDEGSGTTALDSAGSNNGTLTNGPTYSTNVRSGASGYSLSFDGADDTVPFSAIDLRSGNSSYSFWVNPTDRSSNRGILHGQVNFSGIRYNSDTIQYYDTNNANIRTPNSATLNTWKHVVFVVNNNTLRAYVNGVDSGLSTTAMGLKVDGIGWDFVVGSGIRVMQGLIDDVRIYNTALSSVEIAALAGNSTQWSTGTTSLTAGRDVAFNLGGDTLTVGSGKNISVAATGAISSSSAGTISATKSAGVGGGITMTAGSTLGVSNLTLNANNGGAASLTSVGNLNTGVITAGSILGRTTGAGADITLGGNLNGSDAGTAITLASADDFFNSGNYTLTTGGAGGRWLIYSDKPAENTLGTLTGGFNRYTCVYSGACPTFAAETGNGLLYSYTPTLTITPSALTLTYYDAAPSLVGYAYDALTSGQYLNADDFAADSVTGSLTGTTTYTAGSNAGSYNINYDSGSLTSALGYGFAYANNATAITVNKADLTITADDATRVAGASNPTFTGVFTGFVGGQDLGTSGITGDADFTTAAGNSSPAGAYAIVASLGTLTSNNYNFATFVDGTLTVTAAPSGGGSGGGIIITPPVIAPEPPVVVVPPVNPPVITPQPPTTRPEFTIDIPSITYAPVKEIKQTNNPFTFSSIFTAPSFKYSIAEWRVVYYNPKDYPNGQPPYTPNTIYLIDEDEEG